MTSGTDKVRENRLRRMAARQGLTLRKIRRLDPFATDYGTYALFRPGTGGVVKKAPGLDWVEDYLTRGTK